MQMLEGGTPLYAFESKIAKDGISKIDELATWVETNCVFHVQRQDLEQIVFAVLHFGHFLVSRPAFMLTAFDCSQMLDVDEEFIEGYEFHVSVKTAAGTFLLINF